MCTSPISIKNLNYRNRQINSHLVDTKMQYLQVPCGYCSECIHTKQMSIAQRVQMQSLSNYCFFATLTYNNAHLPRLTTSTGYSIPFADCSHLQKMFKRIRKDNLFKRPFTYAYCSELGSKRGRPHFHVLFFLPKKPSDNVYTPLNLADRLYRVVFDQWKVNVSGSTKKPIWEPLFTYKEIYKDGRLYRNYDLHYVSSDVSDDGVSNVAFYVTKYMLKPSDRAQRLQQALRLNLDSEEYERTWSIVRPRFDTSIYMGLNASGRSPFGDVQIDPEVLTYLRKCIDMSEYLPSYFSPSDGKQMPLSHYYKSYVQIYSAQDALRFSDASALHLRPEKNWHLKESKFQHEVQPHQEKFFDDIILDFEI